MEIISVILNVTMIALLVRAIVSIVGGIALSKKIKQAKQNQIEIKERITEQNEQPQPAVQSLMVKDDYCGEMISKEKAYIVNVDDERHYFCSWDCRQKYFSETAQ